MASASDAVVTHADLLTCLGHGEAAWQALLAGGSGLSRATDFWDDELGHAAGHVGRLTDVEGEESRLAPILDMAFDHIVPADAESWDMLVAACSLGDLTGLHAGRPAAVLDAVLARRAPLLRASALLVSSACSSGTDALIIAHAAIRSGQARKVGVLAFDSLPRGKVLQHVALGTQTGDRCRPFDRDRSGTSFGEGAACMVLAASDSVAQDTDVTRVAGVGMSCDAADIVAPDMSGEHAARAMSQAVAGIGAHGLGYINAHGSGTRLSDQAEAGALRLALGDEALDSILVSGSKGAFGHCLGATGLIELVVANWALRDGICPPTPGLMRQDADLRLRVSRERRPLPPGRRAAMSVTCGFGGVNSAVVLHRPEPGETYAHRLL